MHFLNWQFILSLPSSLPFQPWFTGTTCKTLPGDHDWPADHKWTALNSSVNGQLIHYIPTGAVCSESSGHYDAAACEKLLSVHWRQQFVDMDPGLIRCFEYTNNTCDPTTDKGASCTQGYYPEYVVNVTNEADVSTAVRFARDNNVRLNVKNTGHDFTGRSTARGSLSVWIANWRKIEWSEEFTTSCDATKYSAVTVTGGVQWKEIYADASAHDKVFTGGASGTVGVIGGYLQGGGHSPIGPMFGMAADNVLEFTVVLLTTGEVVTANACTNPDLFWALRGGGGGTYGIVTSATLRTYPTVHNVVVGRLDINNVKGQDVTGWKDANAYFHSQLGKASEAGVAGYYFTLYDYTMHFVHVMLNQTVADMEAVMGPVVERLREMEAAKGSGFTVGYTIKSVPWKLYALAYTSEKEMDIGFGDPTHGSGGTVLGSRLITRSAMENDPSAYMDALMFALEDGTAVLGHLTAGGQVARNKGIHNAVNPAWREAQAHIVLYDDLPLDVSREEREAARVRMSAKVARLTSLTPGSAAYMNECDLNQPDKEQTFFGRNYAALYSLKKKYDPHGLMWCSNCVGFRDWSEVDGRLCKAKSGIFRDL